MRRPRGAQQFRRGRCRANHKDLPYAWDRDVGPDILPRFRFVGRRQDLNDQHRFRQDKLGWLDRCAGHGEVRHTKIAARPNPRTDCGLGDDDAGAGSGIQALVYQKCQPCLDDSVRGGGRRHGARLAVHQLPAATVATCPDDEFIQGHAMRYFAANGGVTDLFSVQTTSRATRPSRQTRGRSGAGRCLRCRSTAPRSRCAVAACRTQPGVPARQALRGRLHPPQFVEQDQTI